jgi:hypothetical protein
MVFYCISLERSMVCVCIAGEAGEVEDVLSGCQ